MFPTIHLLINRYVHVCTSTCGWSPRWVLLISLAPPSPSYRRVLHCSICSLFLPSFRKVKKTEKTKKETPIGSRRDRGNGGWEGVFVRAGEGGEGVLMVLRNKAIKSINKRYLSRSKRNIHWRSALLLLRTHHSPPTNEQARQVCTFAKNPSETVSSRFFGSRTFNDPFWFHSLSLHNSLPILNSIQSMRTSQFCILRLVLDLCNS